MRGLVRVGSLRYVLILFLVSRGIISILLFRPNVAVAIVSFLSFDASLYAYAYLLDGSRKLSSLGFGLEFTLSSPVHLSREFTFVEKIEI